MIAVYLLFFDTFSFRLNSSRYLVHKNLREDWPPLTISGAEKNELVKSYYLSLIS